MRIDAKALTLSLLLNLALYLPFLFLISYRPSVPKERVYLIEITTLRAEEEFKEKLTTLKESPSKKVEGSPFKEKSKSPPQIKKVEGSNSVKETIEETPSDPMNGSEKGIEPVPQGKEDPSQGEASAFEQKAIGKIEHPKEDINYEQFYYSNHLSYLRKLLTESLEYPTIARLRGWEGRVVVKICLFGRSLCSVKIEESSGYRVLDEAVIKAVHKVYQNFPEAREKVNLVVPVQFTLKEVR